MGVSMNASLYSGPERRQTPRTRVAAITYINFESNNGGILSNISEGGLCFHAVGPVRQAEELRVWFSADGHRIEANVELAWTDETQKTGGLRFNALSPEMHEQIRNLIRKLATSLSTAQTKWVPSVPKTQPLSALSASRSPRISAPDSPDSLQEFSPARQAALLPPGFVRRSADCGSCGGCGSASHLSSSVRRVAHPIGRTIWGETAGSNSITPHTNPTSTSRTPVGPSDRCSQVSGGEARAGCACDRDFTHIPGTLFPEGCRYTERHSHFR
jgi:hypothetical protein